MEELRERFYGGSEQSKEAFEELFAMVSALEVNLVVPMHTYQILNLPLILAIFKRPYLPRLS